MSQRFSTENLDYLQRTGDVYSPTGLLGGTELAPPYARSLCRIKSVGRLTKDPPENSTAAVDKYRLGTGPSRQRIGSNQLT